MPIRPPATDQPREENPVARFLARRPGGRLGASAALILFPAIIWLAGCWLAAAWRAPGRPFWFDALVLYAAIPTLLLFAAVGDWHFHALLARLRSGGLFDAIALSRLSFHEAMLGLCVASERRAARSRRDLALGLLLPVAATWIGVLGERYAAIAGLGMLPTAAALAWIARSQHRLANATETRLESARALALSLPLLVARDARSAWLLTILGLVERAAVVGPFIGLLGLINTSKGRADAALAWGLLIGSIVFWMTLALWCRWLAGGAGANDDAFAAALRAQLSKRVRRAAEAVAPANSAR